MASTAIFFTISTILFLLTTTTTASNTTIPLPATSPTTYPHSFLKQPPPLTTTPHKQAQMNTIIEAIIGATDFSNWANLLATTDIATIPLSATLFILISATDNKISPTNIVPRRLSFSELQLFPNGAKLPTLLPKITLLITNNSAVNFTINGVQVLKPDLYQNAIVSIHGVSGFLEEKPGFNVSEVRARRKHKGKGRVRHHPEKPPGPGPESLGPVVSAGSKKGWGFWWQVVMFVSVVVSLIQFLGFPGYEIVCGIVQGDFRKDGGDCLYYAGCIWKRSLSSG